MSTLLPCGNDSYLSLMAFLLAHAYWWNKHKKLITCLKVKHIFKWNSKPIKNENDVICFIPPTFSIKIQNSLVHHKLSDSLLLCSFFICSILFCFMTFSLMKFFVQNCYNNIPMVVLMSITSCFFVSLNSSVTLFFFFQFHYSTWVPWCDGHHGCLLLVRPRFKAHLSFFKFHLLMNFNH